MKKIREYELHDEFLKAYGDASLENAQQILNDAKILLNHKSYAIVYFLAVAAIEETGKAYMAFSSRGRNLSNAGLKKKIKEMFENHSQKISSAFASWITKSSKTEESIRNAMELMVQIKSGREKSIYVDVNSDNSLSIPMKIIRPIVAINSVTVAEKCLYYTRNIILENHPPSFSSFDDKFFCLKGDSFKKLFNNADFAKYVLSELKQQNKKFDFSKIVVTYHDKYFSRNKLFSKQRQCSIS